VLSFCCVVVLLFRRVAVLPSCCFAISSEFYSTSVRVLFNVHSSFVRVSTNFCPTSIQRSSNVHPTSI
jgi:hypothetical protein